MENMERFPPLIIRHRIRHHIHIYIYTVYKLAPKLTTTASVERWSRDAWSQVQFPAGVHEVPGGS